MDEPLNPLKLPRRRFAVMLLEDTVPPQTASWRMMLATTWTLRGARRVWKRLSAQTDHHLYVEET